VFSQTTKEDFMKKLLIFAAVIAVVGSASAQDCHEGDAGQARVTHMEGQSGSPEGRPKRHPAGRSDESWRDGRHPDQVASHYRIPTRTHPMAETVTVISGNVGFGMGEKFGR
jgi:hypothetical protein